MVSSARRKISIARNQQEQLDQSSLTYTPVNSTPRGSKSPLFSAYTKGNESSCNGNGSSCNGGSPHNSTVEDIDTDNSHVADFTDSVDEEEASDDDDDAIGAASDGKKRGSASETSFDKTIDATEVDDSLLLETKKKDKKGYCSVM